MIMAELSRFDNSQNVKMTASMIAAFCSLVRLSRFKNSRNIERNRLLMLKVVRWH